MTGLGLLLFLSLILNGCLAARVRRLERGRERHRAEMAAAVEALAASVRVMAPVPVGVVHTPVKPAGRLVLRDAHDRETVAVVPMPETRPRKVEYRGLSYEQIGWRGADMWYRAEGLNGG